MLGRLNRYLTKFGILLMVAASIAGTLGCDYTPPPSQNLEIHTWYDLDAVRDNLDGDHSLMNDLDSTTLGYEELASPTANGGKGWEPIGTQNDAFTGSFDGRGRKICDLYIYRPADLVGLFGLVIGGVLKDIGVLNATVTGERGVGSLAGRSWSTVSNSYATGSVIGTNDVGGLVGCNHGSVSNSYFGGSVTDTENNVGGLVGWNHHGTVDNSYSGGSVTGYNNVGGLVGCSEEGNVRNSYAMGNVTGTSRVGGLVGLGWGNVSNSYSTGNTTGYSAVGGLVGLLIGQLETEGIVSNSHSTGSVIGNRSVGGLVGCSSATVSNSCTVNNSYSTGNTTGDSSVGGLVGWNGYYATVTDSYSTGGVSGDEYVGGLVGSNTNHASISNSYSTGSVTGNSLVGGLVGSNAFEGVNGTVSHSFWDTETSGQATSAGGTGRNTTEMQDIATFSGAGWNITAVANSSTRDPSYIWNIVNNVTYPFLSWQSA